MDATEIAKLGGTVLGAMMASMGATWFMLLRLMKQKQEPEERPSQTIVVTKPQSVPPREPRDNSRFERIEDDVRRVEESLKEMSDSINRRLTTEEFQAYTTYTTGAMHVLTEKVGEVRGQLRGLGSGKGGGGD